MFVFWNLVEILVLGEEDSFLENLYFVLSDVICSIVYI